MNTDLNALDAYLMSDESPEDSFGLSDLDGFIHGLVCSPESINFPEWVEVAMGVDEKRLLKWVTEALRAHYSRVKVNLEENPPRVEPVLWQAPGGHVIAMDWCEGFMDAVKLRPNAWLPLQESKAGSRLMTPILVHLIDDNGNSLMGIPQEELEAVLDEAAKELPNSVIGIYEFWLKLLLD